MYDLSLSSTAAVRPLGFVPLGDPPMLGSATAVVGQRGSSGNSTLRLRKMLCIAALLLALALSPLGVGAARAQLTNGGFETGDLTGWTATITDTIAVTPNSNTVPYTDGSAAVYTTFYGIALRGDPNHNIYPPTEGGYLAAVAGGDQDDYIALAHSFTVSAGDTISGYAFFSTNELAFEGHNDEGYVVIRDQTGLVIAVPFRASVDALGPGDHPWTAWSYTFPPGTGGAYTIEVRSINRGDGASPSFVGLDGVQIIPFSATAPSATTNAATTVTDTSATLNGTVNPNEATTTVAFEWGTDMNYGSTTSSQNIGSGTSAVPVSASLTGLALGTTYHYRVVATNARGTTNGADASFTRTTTTVDNRTATALSVESVSGNRGHRVTLSATLTGAGSPLGGQTIWFTVDGAPVGSATTGTRKGKTLGVASLSYTLPSSASVGGHTIGASFAGDSTYKPTTSGTGTLTVRR